MNVGLSKYPRFARTEYFWKFMKNMHDVEKILTFENPFVQNFYLNYSLRNIELNIHLPFNSMYFETMLQSITGRPLYSICCIWDKKGQHAQNKEKMHEKHMDQLPPSQARHIGLSFNFKYTVHTRPCINEALIINYTQLCYGWNQN